MQTACTDNAFPLTIILQPKNVDFKFAYTLCTFAVTLQDPRSQTSQNDPTEFIWVRNQSDTEKSVVRLD